MPHLISLNVVFGDGLQLGSWDSIQDTAKTVSKPDLTRLYNLPPQNGQVKGILGISDKFLQISLTDAANWIDVGRGAIILGQVTTKTETK